MGEVGNIGFSILDRFESPPNSPALTSIIRVHVTTKRDEGLMLRCDFGRRQARRKHQPDVQSIVVATAHARPNLSHVIVKLARPSATTPRQVVHSHLPRRRQSSLLAYMESLNWGPLPFNHSATVPAVYDCETAKW